MPVHCFVRTAALAWALATATAHAAECDPRHASSPQFVEAGCRLLKLRGRYWLVDPVFGERASPLKFAGPRRFHPPPLALGDLPPVEGLIL